MIQCNVCTILINIDQYNDNMINLLSPSHHHFAFRHPPGQATQQCSQTSMRSVCSSRFNDAIAPALDGPDIARYSQINKENYGNKRI